MKNSKTLIALAVAGMFLVACSGNKENGSADSTAMGNTESTLSADTSMTSDTSGVKPADSTRSFRNDRGTDSVSAGKVVPAQP